MTSPHLRVLAGAKALREGGLRTAEEAVEEILRAAGFGPVLDGTHAILPVEATEEMLARAEWGSMTPREMYRAMVRAHLNAEKAE